MQFHFDRFNVEKLFPVYLVTDFQGIITYASKQINMKCGSSLVGSKFSEIFQIKNENIEDFQNIIESTVIFSAECRFGSQRNIKFFKIKQPNCILFLGSLSHLDTNIDSIGVLDVATELFVVNTINEQLKNDALENAKSFQEQRDRANKLSEAKNRLIANVSHEIRNPLNGILGLATLLELDPNHEKKDQYIKNIKKNGNLLQRITDDMLDLSKIESDTYDFQVEEFSFSEIEESVRNALAVKAQEKGLFLNFEYPRHIYKGDAGRITQIIMNLVDNAIKFTEHGGVNVKVRRNDEVTESWSDCIIISVIDTGIGMSKEVRQKVFEPFFQDALTSRENKGIGLGLSLVQRLTEAMEGSIDIQSEQQKGTSFNLTLPIQLVNAVENSNDGVSLDRDKSSSVRSLRILVVDDDPTNVTVLESYLKSYSVETFSAYNGESAISIAKEHNPQIIFLDIRMPGLSGIDVCRKIRALESANNLPRTFIFAVTANVMMKQIEEYNQAGFDGVIKKPIDFAQIDKAIEVHTK